MASASLSNVAAATRTNEASVCQVNPSAPRALEKRPRTRATACRSWTEAIQRKTAFANANTMSGSQTRIIEKVEFGRNSELNLFDDILTLLVR